MANYFITGSNVLKYWSVLEVKPKDLDIIYIEGTEKPIIESNLRVEYHTLPKELFDKFITENNYITLESLYILKLSHAEYNIHWEKTVGHIQLIKRYLRARGYKDPIFDNLDLKYRELYYALKDYWKIVHTAKNKIKLDLTKDKFFNNKVQRIYDHDFIHETIKYNDQPMYAKCLKDGKEVLLDKSKFDKLTFEDKLNLCREEIYVLALERYLIPSNFKMCIHTTYRTALQRLVTSMSRGWFPDFIVDNYDKLYKIDKNYAKIFQEKVRNYYG